MDFLCDGYEFFFLDCCYEDYYEYYCGDEIVGVFCGEFVMEGIGLYVFICYYYFDLIYCIGWIFIIM